MIHLSRAYCEVRVIIKYNPVILPFFCRREKPEGLGRESFCALSSLISRFAGANYVVKDTARRAYRGYAR
jgi:hypothetical protein